ncbi:hypothetical protein Tco_0535456 [Tanacetum coccineum]
MYQAFKGQPFSTPLSSMPTTTLSITKVPTTIGGRIQFTLPQTAPKPNKGKGIARDTNGPSKKIVPASKEVLQDPDALDQLDTEEKLEQAAREARISKPELIKDELSVIILKKKNMVVKELMISLSKKYKRLGQLHGELRIRPSLPLPEQTPTLSSGRKRKAIELEPEVSHLAKAETRGATRKGIITTL